jgi:hypothetical protein
MNGTHQAALLYLKENFTLNTLTLQGLFEIQKGSNKGILLADYFVFIIQNRTGSQMDGAGLD